MKDLNKSQLNRIPEYLALLQKLKNEGILSVSCQEIADYMDYNIEKVRKDIAQISSTKGIPNKGRDINILINDIESILGYNKINKAVIVGCGSLGKALMKYDGFKDFGLKIVAGFDNSPMLYGKEINNIKIYDTYKLKDVVLGTDVQIGIISVPAEYANQVAENLIKVGIKAIWNFSPVLLEVPEDIIVSNMNMAQSLAVLSHKLNMKNKEK